jgi:hypothetical protein
MPTGRQTLQASRRRRPTPAGTPNGGRYWRLKYRYAGKEKLLAFDVYPEISLAAARERRIEAKKLLEAGTDPSQAKTRRKSGRKTVIAENTFEAVARDWHANKLESWQPRTAENVLHRLSRDIFPLIGRYPISDLKAPLMLDTLR